MEMKNTEVLGLEELLKEKYLQLCSEVSSELINDEFKKICKLILSPSRKEVRNQFRRNSLIGVKSQQNINGRIEA